MDSPAVRGSLFKVAPESPMQRLLGHQTPLGVTPNKTEVDTPTLHYLQKKFPINGKTSRNLFAPATPSIKTNENEPPSAFNIQVDERPTTPKKIVDASSQRPSDTNTIHPTKDNDIADLVPRDEKQTPASRKSEVDRSVLASLSPIPTVSTPFGANPSSNTSSGFTPFLSAFEQASSRNKEKLKEETLETKRKSEGNKVANTKRKQQPLQQRIPSHERDTDRDESLLNLIMDYTPQEFEKRVSPVRRVQDESSNASPFTPSSSSPFTLNGPPDMSSLTLKGKDDITLDFGVCECNWRSSRFLPIVNRYGCPAELLISRIQYSEAVEENGWQHLHPFSYQAPELSVGVNAHSAGRISDGHSWEHSLLLQPMQSITLWVDYHPTFVEMVPCRHTASFVYQLRPRILSSSPPSTKTITLYGTAVEDQLVLPPQIVGMNAIGSKLTFFDDKARRNVVIPLSCVAETPVTLHLSCRSFLKNERHDISNRSFSSPIAESEDPVFSVEPTLLVLQPGQKAEFMVKYHPRLSAGESETQDGGLLIYNPQTETTFSLELQGWHTENSRFATSARGIKATPTWELGTNYLDFGTLEYYHKRRETLSLENTGRSSVNLRLRVVGDTFEAAKSWLIEEGIENAVTKTSPVDELNNRDHSITLQVGERRVVYLKFEAVGYVMEDGLKDYEGELMVCVDNDDWDSTDGEGVHMKRVALRARVGYSRLQVGRGTEKMYFSCPIGSSAVKELPIRNVGCIPLPYLPYFEEGDASEEFAIVEKEGEGRCLAPGAVRMISIRFTPKRRFNRSESSTSTCVMMLDTSSASYCFELYGTVQQQPQQLLFQK